VRKIIVKKGKFVLLYTTNLQKFLENNFDCVYLFKIISPDLKFAKILHIFYSYATTKFFNVLGVDVACISLFLQSFSVYFDRACKNCSRTRTKKTENRMLHADTTITERQQTSAKCRKMAVR
jgi:hypothetical protein